MVLRTAKRTVKIGLAGPDSRGDRVATNRTSQVVPDVDIRWKKGGPHKNRGPYEVDKRWPGAAMGRVPNRHGSE